MKIFTQMTDMKQQFAKTAVALGTFDGVHTGHQMIIGQAVDLAKSSGTTSVVFTFSNHPLSIIDPSRCPPQIVTPEYKAELIAELGADILLTIPFTKEFLQLSPERFINLMLEYLDPSFLIIGPNYHFGYKGAGTPETLTSAGKSHSFQVIVHPAVYVDDIIVSSTTIRQYIQEGKVDQAARLLGRHPRFHGPVTTGEGRGKGMGYPTANLAINEGLVIPGNGVYAVYVHLGDKRYKGVANIGVNPTFQGKSRRIEVFVLDFAGDLYNQFITVDFLQKLRDERTFTNVDELTAQIQLDINVAHKYYK